VKRGNIEQGWANRVKVLRAAIRLKHSIAADNELNEMIDAERKKYFKSVQGGSQPAPIAVKAEVIRGA
jgi:hypothetical protein